MILNYLRKNPDSSDTLKGISKWWFNLEKIDVTVDEISGVLDILIKERKVKKQVINGGNSIYKICKDA